MMVFETARSTLVFHVRAIYIHQCLLLQTILVVVCASARVLQVTDHDPPIVQVSTSRSRA